MKNRTRVQNRVKLVAKLRLYLGWFGLLTPVFGAGVLFGVCMIGSPTLLFVGQVVVAGAINFYIGRKLLKTGEIKKRVGIYG